MNVDDLVDTFELLGDWDARYDFITELGEKAPGLPEHQRVSETQVHGCMSQVWIVGELDDADGARVQFRVDGDAPIVKGLASMLAMIYSGRSPQDIAEYDPEPLFERLGLDEHLSPNRHVGMYAMVEKIKSITRDLAGTRVH
jgi:cysteine desulfuration protein SufE